MVEQPEFFIDRSLGRRAVPDALRVHGLIVHTMADVYGEQVGQGLRDETWLRDVGERGWVVLMKDDAIRRRPAEREALIAGGGRSA
jgi:PIN like domain